MYDADGNVIVLDYGDETDELTREERGTLHLLNALASHTGEVMIGPQVLRWALAITIEQAVEALTNLDRLGMIEMIVDGDVNKPHYRFRVIGYASMLREIGAPRPTLRGDI